MHAAHALLPPRAMRIIGVGMLFALAGCATTLTQQQVTTRRMAFAPVPAPPLAVAGLTGLSVGARGLMGEVQPQSTGGAVAFPSVQPELGALLQLGERSWVGGHVDIASAGLAAQVPPNGATLGGDELVVDIGLGGGHDFALTPTVGLMLSGEVGVAGHVLRSTSSIGSFSIPGATVSLRAAAGGYVHAGPVRLFLAGAGATSVQNEPTSTVTVTCLSTCSSSDSARVTEATVGMAGLGATWRVSPAVALSAQFWVPFSAEGTRLPPMVSLAVSLGDLAVRPKPKPPPVPEPTAPPLLEAPPDTPLL